MDIDPAQVAKVVEEELVRQIIGSVESAIEICEEFNIIPGEDADPIMMNVFFGLNITFHVLMEKLKEMGVE